MSDAMTICRVCRAVVPGDRPLCNRCGAALTGRREPGDGIPRNFTNSIEICFQKYADFSGRAPRVEYWSFVVFSVVVEWGLDLLARSGVMARLGLAWGIGLDFAGGLIGLVLALPALAVTSRRLHDVDRSGSWNSILLLPVIGWILMLVWCASPGTHGSNRYGPENGVA